MDIKLWETTFLSSLEIFCLFNKPVNQFFLTNTLVLIPKIPHQHKNKQNIHFIMCIT